MKCLSDEEIIRYLSVNDISEESMQLVSRVHEHERNANYAGKKSSLFARYITKWKTAQAR